MNNGEVPGSGTGFVAKLITELTGNPINLVLIGVCGYLLYRILKGRRDDETPPEPDDSLPPLPNRDMTVDELRKYDGKQDDGRILMAVNGKVFDVTRGKKFYGPGGPYGIFAGRDASRGLATFCLTEDAIKADFDDLSDLSAMELESVREWDAQFTMKYDYIGRLIKSHEEEKSSDKGASPKDVKPAADAEGRESEKKPPADLTPFSKDAKEKTTNGEKKPTDAEKKSIHSEQPPKESFDRASHLKDADKTTKLEKSLKDELSKDANRPSGETIKPVSEPVKPKEQPSKIVEPPLNEETSSRDSLKDEKKVKQPIDADRKPIHSAQIPKALDEKPVGGASHLKDAEKPQHSVTEPQKSADKASTQFEKSLMDELSKHANIPSGETLKPVSEPVKPKEQPSKIVEQPSNVETSLRDSLKDEKEIKPAIAAEKKSTDAEKKAPAVENKPANVDKKPVHSEQPPKESFDGASHLKDADKTTKLEKSLKDEFSKDANRPSGETVKPVSEPVKPKEQPLKVVEQPSGNETSIDPLKDEKKIKQPINAEKKPTDADKKFSDAERKPIHPEQPPRTLDEKPVGGASHLKDAEKPQHSVTEPQKSADKAATQLEKSLKDELSKHAKIPSNIPSGETVKHANEPVNPYGYREPSEAVEQPSNDETSSRDLLRDANKGKKKM